MAINQVYLFILVMKVVLAGAPSKPPLITLLVSDKPNSIYLQWKNPPLEKVNGIIAGYSVHYRPKGEGDFIAVNLLKMDDTHHAITIKGSRDKPLQGWKTYEVFVQLFNQKYNISSKIEKVFVTGEAPGLAPGNATAMVITENTIELKWNPVPSNYLPKGFQGYNIYYGESGSSLVVYNNQKITSENSARIENLKPGTKYLFALAAVANDRTGPVSERLAVNTASGPLAPPSIEKLVSLSPNNFFVEWKIEPSIISISRLELHYKEKESVDTWIRKDIRNLKNISINMLKSWQKYHVQVELESLGRNSTSPRRLVIVKGKVPGRAPSNIIVNDSKYTYIKIEWEEIDPRYIFGKFVRYIIRYGLNEYRNTVNLNYTKYTNITINNLLPNTAYQFRIAGETEGGVGIYSDYIIKKTKKIQNPAVPIIKFIDTAKPTKVKIRCTSIDDPSMFVVKLIDNFAATEEFFEYPLQTVQQEAPNEYSIVVKVKGFRWYHIELKACILDKCSLFSSPKYVKTKEDKPSKIRNIKVISNGNNDPLITWEKPAIIPGILQYYLLDVKFFYDDESVENYPIKIDNDTYSHVLEELPPFMELNLVMNAVTVGAGPTVTRKFNSPQGLPDQPTHIIVILLKYNVISVKWRAPMHRNGNITGYRITYEGTKHYRLDFLRKKSVDVGTDISKPTRIKNLVPGTTYKVEVAAKTIKGYGPVGKAKHIETTVIAPLPPIAPAILGRKRLKSHSVEVRLNAAVQQYGPINSYQLIIEELFGTDDDDKTPPRKRRSVVLPENIYGYARAKKEGSLYYITADINYNRVPCNFVIGNGKYYNTYKNEPLKAETSYKLHIRATTKDTTKVFYSPPSSLRLPKTLAIKTKPVPFLFPIEIIVAVAVGIVVVIIVIVVVVKCKSNSMRKKEEANNHDTTLFEVKSAIDGEERRPSPASNTYPLNPDHPPVLVAAFPKHVAKLHRMENNGFKAEYPQLKIGKEFSWDVAHLAENKPKNRYANIVAYDHSRVVLSKIHDVPGSDYINASYIDGYSKANAYISTQAPLPSTYNHFWRMVWEVKSCSIVMLTNLQEKNKLKCHKYWPDDSTDYGDVKVTLVRNDSFADFTIRTFKVEDITNRTNQIHHVRQFHFTSWPDHGVPQHPTSMLNFRRNVRSFDKPDDGPTVVHCSAGVGRTGAYISIDSMLERIHHKNDVDIFNFIANMRMRRIAMVQTEDQYIFVHDTIAEAILVGNTEISIHELRERIRTMDQIDSISKVSGFEMQWKTLNHANPTSHKTDVLVGMQGENLNKNRYSTVLPSDSSRVLLLPIEENEASTYINAVYVDSYKQKNAFILTQSPLPRTIIDFWRMVAEHGVACIVMLNAVDEGDDYAKFWPESGSSRSYDMITIESLPDSGMDDIDIMSNNFLKPVYRTPSTELVIRSFQVTDKRDPSKQITTTLFQYVGWTETRVPNSYRPIISLLTQIERWQQQSGRGPIIFMCSDGIGRSGTLAAIIYVLERCKIDQVIDVFQAIKVMRNQRPHAVKYMDQFKYVHFAVQDYMSAFEEHTKL